MHLSSRSLQADYDEKSDTLYLYSKKERVAGSVSIGNINVDYSKKNEVVGLEFLNASTTIPPLLWVSPQSLYEDKKSTVIKSNELNQISKANVSVHTRADLTIISFAFSMDKKELEGKLALQIPTKNDLQTAKQLAKR